jgi:hypothetical protein
VRVQDRYVAMTPAATKLPASYDNSRPGAGAPADELDATLLTFKILL